MSERRNACDDGCLTTSLLANVARDIVARASARAEDLYNLGPAGLDRLAERLTSLDPLRERRLRLKTERRVGRRLVVIAGLGNIDAAALLLLIEPPGAEPAAALAGYALGSARESRRMGPAIRAALEAAIAEELQQRTGGQPA